MSSTGGSQFGIVTYGSMSSSSDIPLGSQTDGTQTSQGITNRVQAPSSGQRDLDNGLRRALSQLSNSMSSSTRSNVVVVVTTGLSINRQATLRAAEELRSLEDTEVFVVGVSNLGGALEEEFLTELVHIGSKPRNAYVFSLRSFTSLNSIFSSLVGEFCDGKISVL